MQRFCHLSVQSDEFDLLDVNFRAQLDESKE